MKKSLSLILILLFFISCSGKHKNNNDIDILLPPTNLQVEMAQWGVTKFSDLKLREYLQDNSHVLKYISVGSLVKIIKRSNKVELFDGKRDYWYLVDYEGLSGWIFGSYIYIYNTKAEAENKCEEMLFNTQEISR